MESGINVARPMYSFPPPPAKKKRRRKRHASEMDAAVAHDDDDRTKLPIKKEGTESEETERGCKSANNCGDDDNVHHSERPPPAKMLRLDAKASTTADPAQGRPSKQEGTEAEEAERGGKSEKNCEKVHESERPPQAKVPRLDSEASAIADLAQGSSAPAPSSTSRPRDEALDHKGGSAESRSPTCEHNSSASSTSDDEDMDGDDSQGSEDDDGTVTLAKCLRQFRSREQLDETDMWCVRVCPGRVSAAH